MANPIPKTMQAMVLETVDEMLHRRTLPVPEPGPGQILIRVMACGVCRTDLHIVDRELTKAKLPLIPGHEIVGAVAAMGTEVTSVAIGDLVGAPWLGSTCGTCRYCRRGRENLCDNALFTGYTINGGYAEYTVADEQYCFPLPPDFPPVAGAPLLCAGLIGYRAYRMAGEDIENLGIYGFGAAAHIIAQVAAFQGKKIYAFTRPGDSEAQEMALRLGAIWAGDSTQLPPEKLDAALIFAPKGELIPAALAACAKGGVVVSGGIHMTDIPSFPYQDLWQERTITSVANLTRRDGEELLDLAMKIPVRTEVISFSLFQANEALDSLRAGKITGAAVLTMDTEARDPL